MTTNIHNIYIGQKFFPCQQRVELIYREELLDELVKALDGNITLLSSPAGFGKSCLLSQFYEHLQGFSTISPIWLSIDAKDNEPNHFFSLVASVLVSHDIVDDSLVSATHNVSAEFHEERIAIQIIKALAHHNKRVVLFLDDFHFITHQRILDFIIHLSNFHLIISTRVTPKLPLSQFATQGLLTLIKADSLRFSEMHAYDLLRRSVPQKQIPKLVAKAEGWPVALQLICLWYKQHPLEKDQNVVFIGDGPIASYMTEQIVEYLDESVQKFLLETSILDRFNASLADAVIKGKNSAKLMHSLTNLETLLIPLEPQKNWFRYHHLISEYLRVQREANLDLSEIQLLHERASHWYFRNNILSDAILHGQKTGNPSIAVEHVFKFGGWKMILTKGIGFVESILHYFSEEVIRESSVLTLMRCYLNLKLGNVRKARDLLELAKCLEYVDLTKDIDKNRLVILEQIVQLYEDKADIDTIKLVYKDLSKDDFLAKGILEAGLALMHIQMGEFSMAKQFAISGFLSMKNAGCLVGATYLLFHKGQSIAYSGQIEKSKTSFS
ncbi:MAG: hypothetical protein Q9M92_02870 [Enterobacterales bacterium]|nr:hypothetical protein [Enterobacterales bacterium]